MNHMKWIRKEVFGVTQMAFADLAGVSHGAILKWENHDAAPGRNALSRIREAARERGIEWDDSWFFEKPQDQENA